MSVLVQITSTFGFSTDRLESSKIVYLDFNYGVAEREKELESFEGENSLLRRKGKTNYNKVNFSISRSWCCCMISLMLSGKQQQHVQMMTYQNT
jgi:hypothetical protein